MNKIYIAITALIIINIPLFSQNTTIVDIYNNIPVSDFDKYNNIIYKNNKWIMPGINDNCVVDIKNGYLSCFVGNYDGVAEWDTAAIFTDINNTIYLVIQRNKFGSGIYRNNLSVFEYDKKKYLW
jgi:hypothetical protein